MGKGGKGEARKLLCVRVAIASHARRTHAHRAASTYYVSRFSSGTAAPC
jgi:hypothetical protein